MKNHYFIFILFISSLLNVSAQYNTLYESSFRDWDLSQDWVIIDTDTITPTIGIVNKSITTTAPNGYTSTEIMDYMLGVKNLTGESNKIMITPPIVVSSNTWAQFYSFKSASVTFSCWVLPDASNTSLLGITDSLFALNSDQFNLINLSTYANTTIRLAFKITGLNPTAYIDDLKIFDKTRLAYIPDITLRTHLQSVIPSAFIGDSLNYTSNEVVSLRRIIKSNSTIQSMEGMQYFVFLKQINVSNNQISFFPTNRLPYIDTFIVNNNFITNIPDVPIAKYINYDNNLANNIPDYFNQQISFLHGNNNLIYDCLQCSNRFAEIRLLNNVHVLQNGCMYYDLQFSYNYAIPPPCSNSQSNVYGIVYYDINNDGIQDAGDINLANQTINFSQGTNLISSTNGHYSTTFESGQASLNVIPSSFFQCTNPFSAVLSEDQSVEHNFRIIANGVHNDYEVNLFNSNNIQVDQEVVITLFTKNNGTEQTPAVVKFPLPSGTAFVSSNYGSVIGDTLYWDVNLLPFQQINNSVTLTVLGLAINQNHLFNVSVSVLNDENLADNTAESILFISDSLQPHDPNNKIVSTPIVDTNFHDYLYYTINFENIGLGDATYVAIKDQLSPLLNGATFEFLGATHPCIPSFVFDDYIQFTFNSIVLTPTSVDSLHSKGTVWFRIKPLNPIQLGDTIYNEASIIFNTEAPIITNKSTVWAEVDFETDFSANSSAICQVGNISFDELSTANPLFFEWHFEGGTPSLSNQISPTIHYNSLGTFDVTLITRWQNGQIDTIIKNDYVSVGYDASIVFSPQSNLCENDAPIELSASPSGGQFFGNGVNDSIFDPSVSGTGVSTIYYKHTNQYGCSDSMITQISIHSNFQQNDTVKICQGENFAWQNTDYSSEGIYTSNFTNINGCDSNYTLNLVVNPSYIFNESQTICGGQTYTWNGMLLDSTGIYTLINVSNQGCDSIHKLNLTILPSYSFSESQSICSNENYSWHGSIYNSPGTYTQHYSTEFACDSTYYLDLSIYPDIDTSISLNGDQLISNAQNSSYQWIDCDNNFSVLIGETNQNFKPSSNGNYAVVVSNQECSDTSRCVEISNVGINKLNNHFVQIAPNPFDDFVFVQINDYIAKSLEIYSANGKLIQTFSIKQTNKIDTSKLSSGLYYFKFVDGKESSVLKMVKN